MNTGIFYQGIPGSEQSGKIMLSAMEPVARRIGGSVITVRGPARMPRETVITKMRLGHPIDCAVFMEQILDHPALLDARYRILVPNPEWLDTRTKKLAAGCTHIWHKSHDSLVRLQSLFPNADHAYIGFTSRDPGQMVDSYETFVHLRGNLQTNRSTDCILAHWHSRRDLPDLYAQFYWKQIDGIAYPGWLHDHNVHLRMGWLAREEYLSVARTHGIHVCTSEAEGFGHYINEARAMGALVITTDGAPMNELIDASSGILVKPSATRPMAMGTRHVINADDFGEAIDRVVRLSIDESKALGAAARARYVAEAQAFRSNVDRLFEGLH